MFFFHENITLLICVFFVVVFYVCFSVVFFFCAIAARELGVDMTPQDWKSLLDANHAGGARPIPSPSPTNQSEVSTEIDQVDAAAAAAAGVLKMVCWDGVGQDGDTRGWARLSWWG